MLKWIVGFLALSGAIFGILQSTKNMSSPPVPPLRHEPPKNPYPKGIAGAGIVEPASQNVVIGVTDPGLVTKVFVVPGQKVKAGEPLYQIDTRSLESQLVPARAQVPQFEAALQQTVGFRRKEEEPGLRAHVAEGESTLQQAERDTLATQAELAVDQASIEDYRDRISRFEHTVKAGASTEDELVRAKYQLQILEAKLIEDKANVATKKSAEAVAKSKLAESQADLDLYLAGPWAPNVQKAKADLEQAKAQVARLEMDLERFTIRAPHDAIVNSCYLKEGEYAPATRDQADLAALVLGSLGPLHVRVDIDEFDAPRFKTGSNATAYLKGNRKDGIRLEFVRIEPFIIPKRSLTNSQTELVDTRVLQVIYRVASPQANLYVGQQMDIFVDSSDSEPIETK